MKNIKSLLSVKENISAIRLYAIGEQNTEDFKEEVIISEKVDSFKLYINKHAHLNTWGYGDILVSIEKNNGYLTVFYKDIDGDDCSKNWFVLCSGKGMKLETLLEENHKSFNLL